MSAPAVSVHASNVDAGIALLDKALGRNVWLPRINLPSLDVASSDRCVACQATRVQWYPDAVRVLGLNLGALGTEDVFDEHGVRSPWTERHGFGISWESVGEGMPRDFPGLQAEWVRRIELLRREVA